MTLKKYYPFVILNIIFLSLVIAQNHRDGHGGQAPKGCEIYGTVVDSMTGVAIEYASISVIKGDNNIETGGITNSEGVFEIEKIKPGTYVVKIEFMAVSISFSD